MRFFAKRQPHEGEQEVTAESLGKKKFTKVHGRRIWGEENPGEPRIEHVFDRHDSVILTIAEFGEKQQARASQKPGREPREAVGVSGPNPSRVLEDEGGLGRRSLGSKEVLYF